jgi:hypothetical protein
MAALLCFGEAVPADSTPTQEATIVKCMRAANVADPSLRGEMQDSCMQQAGDICKAASQRKVSVCYDQMAADLSVYVDTIVPLLPASIVEDGVPSLSYLREIDRLTTGGWSRQSCMVPSIATVSTEVRNSLCNVQSSYTRIKLAFRLASKAMSRCVRADVLDRPCIHHVVAGGAHRRVVGG